PDRPAGRPAGMIDLASQREGDRSSAHDPRPLTAAELIRLVVAAATAVAVQASVLDSVTLPLLRHLDLPLTAAAVLVLARPTQSVTIGLIFGLMVDASSQRLFGIHSLAYASLGPVAHVLPVPAWQRRGWLVCWRAGVQGLTAASIVALGQTVAAGGVVNGTVAGVGQSAVLVGLGAVPASRLAGFGAPLGSRRTVRRRPNRPGIGRGLRPGPIRPLGR
ncbi:MAG: hypothetical protein AAFO29_16480, partial [Actinomycetota bacterium]